MSNLLLIIRVRSSSGAQNRFLSTGLDDHSSLLRYVQALTFLKQKLQITDMLIVKDLGSIYVKPILKQHTLEPAYIAIH